MYLLTSLTAVFAFSYSDFPSSSFLFRFPNIITDAATCYVSPCSFPDSWAWRCEILQFTPGWHFCEWNLLTVVVGQAALYSSLGCVDGANDKISQRRISSQTGCTRWAETGDLWQVCEVDLTSLTCNMGKVRGLEYEYENIIAEVPT